MKFEFEEQIGKYPIVREIGTGATSRVYLARDPFADRDVAIKVFLFEQDISEHTERMMHKAFLAEAALAGKLSHPHIVAIFDAVVEACRRTGGSAMCGAASSGGVGQGQRPAHGQGHDASVGGS